MAKLILLFLLLFITFLDAASIVGNWVFDLKHSIEVKNKFKSIYNRLEGMQIKIDPNGRYTIRGRGNGRWLKEGDHYILAAKSGKKMTAKLHSGNRLEIVQSTQAGKVPLYFTKGVVKSKDISNYIYLNRVYKQKERIYDNGYLYYLFLNDGTFYSYATNKTGVTATEIKKRGDRLKYRFLGDKIVMKGPFKVVIRAYGKEKIVTSQGDKLYLQP